MTAFGAVQSSLEVRMKKASDGAFGWKIEKIVSKGDYNYAVVFEHPCATKHGYVLEHRIVVENHLGRLLNPNEVVHHKNGEKKDNRIENLDVLPGQVHARLHGMEQGQKWCELKCPNCSGIFHRPLRQTFLQKSSRFTTCSPRCRGQLSRLIQLNGLTPEVEQAISGNLVREYRKYIHDNPEETV